MKIIKPKAELLIQPSGIEGIYKQIELCGRTCYKSEDKITENSANSFVDRMIISQHTAMLEHGTVYLRKPNSHKDIYEALRYSHSPYSAFSCNDEECFITTNYRVLVENKWLEDLEFLCVPNEVYHMPRYTIRFTCSRAVAQELTRHRAFSFAMESQRYCNYSKDKFNNEVTFIEPYFIDDAREFDGEAYDNVYELLCSAYEEAEGYYQTILDNGFPPEAARDVLPNATKTELCMTGFKKDWEHFFNLRLYGATGKPHPDMKIIAGMANDEIKKYNVTKYNALKEKI